MGDLFMVGFRFNYDVSVVMNYIYFMSLFKGVGLVVEMVKGSGWLWVYVVEFVGEFENDLNVMDKKFLGNFMCLYCSL